MQIVRGGGLSGPAPGPADRGAARRPRLMVWSAADPQGEQDLRRSLRRWLEARGETGFAQVAQAWGRAEPGPVRGAVVAADCAEALALLGGPDPSAPSPGAAQVRQVAAEPLPVVLLLPGQGAERPRMARGFYGWDPVFTRAADEVLALAGRGARADWLAEPAARARPDTFGADAFGADAFGAERATRIHHSLVQLFAVDYATARLLAGWGVRPAALLGQGIGELVAAVLAGVMALEDAVRLVALLAEEAAALAPGGMLAVAAGLEQLRGRLADGVMVAALNGPTRTVLAGPGRALADTAERLTAAGYECLPVRTGAAYHTPHLAQACARVAERLPPIALRPPRLPLYSPSMGAVLTAGTAQDLRHWTGLTAAPVRLRDALDALFADGDWACVESGPGQGLGAVVRRHPAAAIEAAQTFSTLRARPGSGADDQRAALSAAAGLWLSGHHLDFEAIRSIG
ncbi:acyltransferase domain-containing protein [Kitasatospora sp. NPDC092948]|uniref:acyltransferase domain-containing protein n=1 Tax=Kitasatospora sp. NPDC092948 TaxID=3364088 RepID=UPI00380324CD